MALVTLGSRVIVSTCGLFGLGTALISMTACSDPTTILAVVVDSAVVLSIGVDPDPTRTYEADRTGIDPGSALTELGVAGLPIDVAWYPLSYVCDDARGERLTVQLTRPDPRMADHGFSPGTGRLHCSQTLMRYLVIRNLG